MTSMQQVSWTSMERGTKDDYELLGAEFEGLRESDDARDVFGAAPPILFLGSAYHAWFQPYFGAPKLVPNHRR